MCHLSSKREQMQKKGEMIVAYFASVWWHDEKRLYVMLLKEGMSLVAEARLHLVVSVQTLQGGPRDVHLAESTSRAEDARQLVIEVRHEGLKSLCPSLFSPA